MTVTLFLWCGSQHWRCTERKSLWNSAHVLRKISELLWKTTAFKNGMVLGKTSPGTSGRGRTPHTKPNLNARRLLVVQGRQRCSKNGEKDQRHTQGRLMLPEALRIVCSKCTWSGGLLFLCVLIQCVHLHRAVSNMGEDSPLSAHSPNTQQTISLFLPSWKVSFTARERRCAATSCVVCLAIYIV